MRADTTTNEDAVSSLYSLVNALFTAARDNTVAEIRRLTTLTQEHCEKCNGVALAAGLAEKATAGDNAGKNAWFFLSAALDWAIANKNDSAINKISTLIKTGIDKCDGATLAAGLAEKATAGVNAGKNAWYGLTLALDWAGANKNDDAINNISTLIEKCINKCDGATLAAGLAEKVTAGNGAGKNAWHWLMLALDRAVANKDDAAITVIFTYILDILSKLQYKALPEEVNRIIAINKNYLVPYFENYLKEKAKKIGIDAFEKECGPNTAIDQLINDNQLSTVKNLVNTLIQTEKEKIKCEQDKKNYLQTVYTQLLKEKMKALNRAVHRDYDAISCDKLGGELLAAFAKAKKACKENGIEINIDGKTIKQWEDHYFDVMFALERSTPVAPLSTAAKPSNRQLQQTPTITATHQVRFIGSQQPKPIIDRELAALLAQIELPTTPIGIDKLLSEVKVPRGDMPKQQQSDTKKVAFSIV